MLFYSQAVISEKSLSRCFQAELTDHFYFLRVERHQGKKKTETFLMVECIQTCGDMAICPELQDNF